MTWARLDDAAATDRKVIRAVGMAGPTAFALWTAALCHACRYLTDGLIDSADVRGLLWGTDPRQPAAGYDVPPLDACIRAGLFDERDGEVWVHDFTKYNGTREETLAKREAASKRMSELRSGQRSPPVRANTPRTEPEQEANEARTKLEQPRTSPVVREVFTTPTPTPLPTPQSGERASAPAATPLLSDLAVKIHEASASLPHLGAVVDEAFANELALHAERGGKAALALKALDEASGQIGARSLRDATEIRSLVMRFVKQVRPEAVVSGPGGGKGSHGGYGARHGPPTQESRWGDPTDDELRAAGVIS